MPIKLDLTLPITGPGPAIQPAESALGAELCVLSKAEVFRVDEPKLLVPDDRPRMDNRDPVEADIVLGRPCDSANAARELGLAAKPCRRPLESNKMVDVAREYDPVGGSIPSLDLVNAYLRRMLGSDPGIVLRRLPSVLDPLDPPDPDDVGDNHVL